MFGISYVNLFWILQVRVVCSLATRPSAVLVLFKRGIYFYILEQIQPHTSLIRLRTLNKRALHSAWEQRSIFERDPPGVTRDLVKFRVLTLKIILMYLRRIVERISRYNELWPEPNAKFHCPAKSFVTKRDSLRMCSFVPAGFGRTRA